jgi:hypothetical protein
VTVKLPPSTIPSVHLGDKALVTLPDGSSKPGTVTEIGAVAVPPPAGSGDSGSNVATAPVTVTVTGTIEGFLDQAHVQVLMTTAEHKDVLAVPTVALFAVPGGKYEVIVVNGSGRQHVAVDPRLFDDTAGVTEVTGNISAGQLVEVPGGGS